MFSIVIIITTIIIAVLVVIVVAVVVIVIIIVITTIIKIFISQPMGFLILTLPISSPHQFFWGDSEQGPM